MKSRLQKTDFGENDEEEEDDDDDDDDEDVNGTHVEGMYDPEEFADLNVSPEIR